MIVTGEELEEVEAVLEAERGLLELLEQAEAGKAAEPAEEALLPRFFGKYPHLLLALGFDEYVVLEKPSDGPIKDPWRDVAGHYGIDTTTLVYETESLYRARDSGAWYVFDGLTDAGHLSLSEDLHFIGPTNKLSRAFPTDAWVREVANLVEKADARQHHLWFPGCWTPTLQRQQRSALATTVDPLLEALQSGAMDLRALHWRELEEVVAELLADRGLDIHVTPRSRDGGRDVVARGELIPGEPMQIAIEVKQKPVVNLSDVHRALYANESFPALMVATAGTFSAGVVAEKGRERNAMRLFLKDGIALQQWLSARAPGDCRGS